MKTKTVSFNYSLHCVAGLACLGLLAVAGCVVEPDGRVYAAPIVVAPAPVVVVESDLIYYPGYEVYYDPGARLYWYSRGGAWVTDRAPPGISVDVLLASPSIHTGFRDSPQNHHADIVRQYPRNWRPNGRGPAGPGGPDGPGDRNRRG